MTITSRRPPNSVWLPQRKRRGQSLFADDLNRTVDAVKQITSARSANQVIGPNAGIASIPQHAIVTSFPTFDPAFPGFVKVKLTTVDPSEPELDVTFPRGLFLPDGTTRDGFTYTYIDINGRNANDGSTITFEELTPKILVGDTVKIIDVAFKVEVDPGPPQKFEFQIVPHITNYEGRQWASETALGAGMGA